MIKITKGWQSYCSKLVYNWGITHDAVGYGGEIAANACGAGSSVLKADHKRSEAEP